MKKEGESLLSQIGAIVASVLIITATVSTLSVPGVYAAPDDSPSNNPSSLPPPQYTYERSLTISPVLSTYVQTQDTMELWLNLSIINFRNTTIENVLVHNELADEVSLISSSPLPSKNESELAWSIGDMPPFSLENITLQLRVDSSTSDFTTLDKGFSVYGTINGEPVYSNLSSLTLLPSSFAEYIKSTVDANKTDSYVLLQSQLIGNNPADIFEFVRDEIEYESYNGSLRGARGTLWSLAGNSIDQSNLLVALLRASGIPCRYAHGTLPDVKARELIASMFPTPENVIGSVPEGMDVADPVNDTTLIAEAKNHTWVEYYSNGEWVSLDPSFEDAQIGDSFCIAEMHFTEVPDSWRHKVTFRLKLEKDRSSISYPLTYTASTAELYGKKIALGHDVDIATACLKSWMIYGCIKQQATITYKPYLLIGNEKIYGTSFTDVYKQYTSPMYKDMFQYMFGAESKTQYTGEWLQFEVDDLSKSSDYERMIFDKVGYVNRKKGTPVEIDTNVSVSPVDLFTMVIVPGKVPSYVKRIEALELLPVFNEMNETKSQYENKDWDELTAEQKKLLKEYTIGTTFLMALDYCGASDFTTNQYGELYLTKSYFDSPRIIIVSLIKLGGSSNFAVDLRKNNIRALLYPKQSEIALIQFRQARGIAESSIEGAIIEQFTNQTAVTVPDVFREAKKQEISIKIIMPITSQEITAYVDNITIIDISDDDKAILISNALIIPTYNVSEILSLNISEEAKYRIIETLESGHGVIVPEEMVRIGNITTIAWWEIDPETHEIVGVFENGLHFSFWTFFTPFLYGMLMGFLFETLFITITEFIPWFAYTTGVYVGLSYIHCEHERAHPELDLPEPTWKTAKNIAAGDFEYINKFFLEEEKKTVEEIADELGIEDPTDVIHHLLMGLAHIGDFYRLYGSVGGHTRWLNEYIRTGQTTKAIESMIKLGRARTHADYTGIWKHPTAGKAWGIGSSFVGGIIGSILADHVCHWALTEIKKDPPLPPLLMSSHLNITQYYQNPSAMVSTISTSTGNVITANLTSLHFMLSGSSTSAWNSTIYNSFEYNNITAENAEIYDLDKNLIETGNATILPISNATGIYGDAGYRLTGDGDLSFYAPAARGFGVGGNWTNYNVSVSGNFIIDAIDATILVNGTVLTGHYLINSSSATIEGAGFTAVPSFASEAAINASDCNLIIGDSSGSLSINGNALDPGEGISLIGFSGTLSIREFNATHNEVIASGTFERDLMTHLLPRAITTTPDQNVTLSVAINSNADDVYNVTASVPDGWGVIVKENGKIIVIPEPGATSGTYTVSVTTISTTEPGLVATATSTIEISSVKGVEVDIEKDELITVPIGDNIYNGIPSAYTINIRNKGNSDDTFLISTSGLPGDWILLSNDKLTIPAGKTYSVGLYVKPTDTILPTSQDFTVTVASTTDPSVSDSAHATFEMPEVRGVDVNVTPKMLNVTQTGAASFYLNVTSQSNTDDTYNITLELPEGWTASYVNNASLSMGESFNQTVSITIVNATIGEVYFVGISAESIFNKNASDYEILSLYVVESVADTLPPVITNVNVTSITNDSAIITWETDEMSDSLVKYGTESENYTTILYNETNVTSHIVNLTKLNINTTYYFVVNSTDQSGNSNESIEYNFTTAATSDTTPPASISNLDEIDKGTTWILWNWTNPPDPDFNYTEVWIDGEFKDKVTTPEHLYNATGLNPDTTYEIGTRTVDNSGNVNQTWVNDTATTLSLLIHDINVSTDYAPETNGIKIKYDGTEIPASENLTIGNTYHIYYKIMNEGDYNETVDVTVKIVNSTWNQTIATHTWSIKVGKHHYAPSGGDSWDTSGLTPGNYNLTVNASIPTDDDWSNNERIRAVTLALPPNQPPVSDPNGPYTGTEGVPLSFNGSGSYDPDGTIVSYAWNFGDGNTSTVVNPTHTYAQNGTYTVTLTVTDNEGATDTSTTTATIADTEPNADFTGTPTSGPEPLTVAFTDASTSYDGIVAWAWDFGDGNTSTEQNPTHVYAEAGLYTVSLTVYEADGDSDTETKVDYINVSEVLQPELCPDEYRWNTSINPKGYKWDPFPTLFRAWNDVHFVNNGTGDAYNVIATITCAPVNVNIIDGNVTLGDIPAGGSAWSKDFFELEVDMTNPQGPDKGICWRVEYDDAAGVHHVVENVPKFCGENCSDICP